MPDEIVRLDHVSKSFDQEIVIRDLELGILKNEFITLLGPSGCGKTTTLRMIGGFEKPDSGRILFKGHDITNVPPYMRPLNTVFQRYALFPHMDVMENIAFGLKISGKSKSYISDKIRYALKLVNMDGYEHRNVRQLSGGQQQRIAIARAIVNEPELLLLDEPLGALDLKLRKEMQRELIRLKKELGITFIYVTHDQEEALTMSDRVVVMNMGNIQQMGTPEEIYNEPENAFVADFVGESNIIDGIMLEDCLVSILGRKFACVDTGFGTNRPVDVQIRPEDLVLLDADPTDENALNGTVTEVIFKGVFYEIFVNTGGFIWRIQNLNPKTPGSQVRISVDPYNIQIMNKPVSEDEEVFGERDKIKANSQSFHDSI